MGLGRRKLDILLLNHSGAKRLKTTYSDISVPVKPVFGWPADILQQLLHQFRGDKSVCSTICWLKWSNISAAVAVLQIILKSGVIFNLQCQLNPPVFIYLSIYSSAQ